MLALVGLVAVVALVLLISTRVLSPLVALITVPIVAALAAGFGLEIGRFVGEGLVAMAPVVAMASNTWSRRALALSGWTRGLYALGACGRPASSAASSMVSDSKGLSK